MPTYLDVHVQIERVCVYTLYIPSLSLHRGAVLFDVALAPSQGIVLRQNTEILKPGSIYTCMPTYLDVQVQIERVCIYTLYICIPVVCMLTLR